MDQVVPNDSGVEISNDYSKVEISKVYSKVEISKVFMDDNAYIYVVDKNGLLYAHDTKFYPFTALMTNIETCFLFGEDVVVLANNTVYIYDQQLHLTNIFGKKNDNTPVNEIAYDNKHRFISTLENSELFVLFKIMGIEDPDVLSGFEKFSLSRMFIPQTFQAAKLIWTFDRIKVVDGVIIAISTSTEISFALVYSIGHLEEADTNDDIYNRISLVGKLFIEEEMFDKIMNYNPIHQIFLLRDGRKLNLSGSIYEGNGTDTSIDTTIFENMKCFFIRDNNLLLCYYDNSVYLSVIQKLIETFPGIISDASIKPDAKTPIGVTTLILPPDIDFQLITRKRSQMFIYNRIPYIINRDDTKNTIGFQELVFSYEDISYTFLHAYYPEKTSHPFIIDIDPTGSIVDQLIALVPNIYRLNKEYQYEFEQVLDGNRVTSFGDGVTRQVFDTLRIELDGILASKFDKWSVKDCIRLGKLFYFCNRDGEMEFANLDGYFYYLLSIHTSKMYDLTVHFLLSKFHSKDYELYITQYELYKQQPEKLVELDMDLETVDNYVAYLMNSHLDSLQIEKYKSFVEGYWYFASRQTPNVINHLPINYYIDLLSLSDTFNLKIEFLLGQPTTIEDYTLFCDAFKKYFDGLAVGDQRKFTHTVTGSEYYHGTINIAYNRYPPGSNLTYKISTCESLLMVAIDPDVESVKNLVDMLIIRDTCLVDTDH